MIESSEGHLALLVLLLGGVSLLSWVASLLLMRYLWRFNVIDKPNKRSSHHAPVPRGGGLAFVFVASAAVYVCDGAGLISFGLASEALLAGLLLAAVGFLEDVLGLSRMSRLAMQALVALWVVMGHVQIQNGMWLWPEHLAYPYKIILAGLMVLLVVWLVNAVNFIDGIDGYACLLAISILLSTTFLLSGLPAGDTHVFALLMVASLIGFLCWNLPPARMFMGDAGALWIGLVIAVVCLDAMARELMQFTTWLVLLALILGDTTWTLLWRIFSGQAWYQAHRSHAYQKLSILLGSHRKVDIVAVLFQFAWLLPVASLDARYPQFSAFWLFLAYWPVLASCYYLKAGVPSSTQARSA